LIKRIPIVWGECEQWTLQSSFVFFI